MAIIKHIKIRNSNYDASTDYLCFQHNEYNSKPILNDDGEMIPRDFYLLDGINCNPYNFARECETTNAYYQKNQTKDEIKAHHYILSFDPRDKDENGLTAAHAQALGIEFASRNFPGHQTLICTHLDGHNSSGNIHVHIIINSVRKLDVTQEPFMERKSDCKAGNKHRSTNKFLKHLKQETMTLCQREQYYQVDLLSPSSIRITDKEYWAQRRGQVQLDIENKKKIENGIEPEKTTFETQKSYLRRIITAVLNDSLSYEEFQKKLFEQYGISIHESRGRISYILPDREMPIRGRQLGTSFEKDYILENISVRFKQLQKSFHVKSFDSEKSKLIDSIRLIVDIESNDKAQNNKYYAQKVKISNLQQMSNTLIFLHENHIETIEDIEKLLDSTHADFLSKQTSLKSTENEIKNVNLLIKYSGQCLTHKKTYNDYLRSKNKQKFREEHLSDIVLYESARKELKKILNGKKLPSIKQLRERKESLVLIKNQQYEAFSFSRSKLREIQIIEKNIYNMLNLNATHQRTKFNQISKSSNISK